MRFGHGLLELIATRPQRQLLRFLLAERYTPRSGRDLARLARVPSAWRLLRQFQEVGLIYPARVGKAYLWRVDTASWAYRELSRVWRYVEGLPSPLEHLQRTLRKCLAVPGVERVVLFGSVAEGRERRGSDIDVFLLVRDAETRKRVQPAIETARSACLRLYGNSLAPFLMTRAEAERGKRLPVMESIAKGLVVWEGK